MGSKAGSAGMGAAQGFAMGGPIGAGIGAVAAMARPSPAKSAFEGYSAIQSMLKDKAPSVTAANPIGAGDLGLSGQPRQLQLGESAGYNPIASRLSSLSEDPRLVVPQALSDLNDPSIPDDIRREAAPALLQAKHFFLMNRGGGRR